MPRRDGGTLASAPRGVLVDGVLSCLSGAELLRFRRCSRWAAERARDDAAPARLLRFYRDAGDWCGPGSSGGGADVSPPLLGRTAWSGAATQRRDAERTAALLAATGWNGARLPAVLSVLAGGGRIAEPGSGFMMGRTVAGPLLRCLGVPDGALAPPVHSPDLRKRCSSALGDQPGASVMFRIVDCVVIAANVAGAASSSQQEDDTDGGWNWALIARAAERMLMETHAAVRIGDTPMDPVVATCGIATVTVLLGPAVSDSFSRRALAVALSNRNATGGGLSPAAWGTFLPASQWTVAGVFTLSGNADPRVIVDVARAIPRRAPSPAGSIPRRVFRRIAELVRSPPSVRSASLASDGACDGPLRALLISPEACTQAHGWAAAMRAAGPALRALAVASTSALDDVTWSRLAPNDAGPFLQWLSLDLELFNANDVVPLVAAVVAHHAPTLQRLRLSRCRFKSSVEPCATPLGTSAFPQLTELELSGCASAAAVLSVLLRHRPEERFPRLRRVAVRQPEASLAASLPQFLVPSGVTVASALPLVGALPCLEVLEADEVTDGDMQFPVTFADVMRSFAAHFPAMTTLTLPRAPLTKTLIERLLAAMPTLTTIGNVRNPGSSLRWPQAFAHRATVVI